MFTGIIEDIGDLARFDRSRDLATLTISTRLRGLRVSGSIAVNGVCLTIVRLEKGKRTLFTVEAARETLDRTTVRRWKPQASLNLERPLRVGSELGGHFVQGHVDGVGTVCDKHYSDGGGVGLTISAPRELTPFIVEKGSIAIDGVSLTVNRIERKRCFVHLIPYTLGNTALGTLERGHLVNIETDLLARHVEKLLRRN